MAIVTLLGIATTAAVAQAPTGPAVAGTIRNGTSHQPVPGAAVELVELQGNMQQLAATHSDAQGHFHFDPSAPAGTPMMVQVEYAGVPYFLTLSTAANATSPIAADLTVYDARADEHRIHINAEILVVQPENGQLAVVDEFRIENQSDPPATLMQSGGLFRFRVPAGATVDSARIVPPGGLPIGSNPTPTSDHSIYRLDYPLRPGETSAQVAFRIPYAGFKTEISERPLYPTEHFEAYVPEAMNLQGAGFVKVGNQQGYNVFGIDGAAKAGPINFTVAGDAPLPPDPQAAGSDAGAPVAGGGTTAMAAPAGQAATDAAPPVRTFMERNVWTVLALLSLLAAAGCGKVFAQSRPATAATGMGGATAGLTGVPEPAAPADADELRRLKDDLFLLEVRRHTGNIDAAAYAHLRAEIDQRMSRIAQGR